MPVLRVHLLGGLTLTSGDTPLPPIPGATARSLLAYLIAYWDRPAPATSWPVPSGPICPTPSPGVPLPGRTPGADTRQPGRTGLFTES
jgi:hypothetical protein